MRKLVIGDAKTMGQFETLCAFHTPISDMAAQFGVSEKTLHAWVVGTYKEDFRSVYQRFMQNGNSLLNKSALKLAEKNAYMNIWLRKQWLKEKDPDKAEQTNSVDVEDWSPIAEMLKDD